MRTLLKPSRLFLPHGGFERWAVPAGDSHALDRGFWERVARSAVNAPSSFHYILPDVYAQEETDENTEAIREKMYSDLEEEKLDRLGRGFVLVKHTQGDGARYGIVAALDLEAFSYAEGESAPVRSLDPPSSRAYDLALARIRMPLECPHITLFYRDKKDKTVRDLLAEDLEKVYSFPLMEDGGGIEGFFIPEDLAYEVSDGLRSRGEPCFLAADGQDELAAAKIHWDAVKTALGKEEFRYHPARFTLVELVNASLPENGLIMPVRVLSGVEADSFLDFFTRRVKCKGGGQILFPALSGAEGVLKTDALIEEFLRANGGQVRYEERTPMLQEDEAAVVLKELDIDELFKAAKSGKLLPHAFTVGEQKKRYCLECREISYD